MKKLYKSKLQWILQPTYIVLLSLVCSAYITYIAWMLIFYLCGKQLETIAIFGTISALVIIFYTELRKDKKCETRIMRRNIKVILNIYFIIMILVGLHAGFFRKEFIHYLLGNYNLQWEITNILKDTSTANVFIIENILLSFSGFIIGFFLRSNFDYTNANNNTLRWGEIFSYSFIYALLWSALNFSFWTAPPGLDKIC